LKEIERSFEVTERRGRRSKQLLEEIKEKLGYWKLQEEALERTLWRPALKEAVDLS